nr:hypothetical protein [Tanacetum cinerariifolium]
MIEEIDEDENTNLVKRSKQGEAHETASSASPQNDDDEETLAETLMSIKKSAVKDKGKAIMQVYKPSKKIKKNEMTQISLKEKIAQRFYEKKQAQLLMDEEYAQQVRAQCQELIEWKLYDSCGVYSLMLGEVSIHMLVEKMYPLPHDTLTRMLQWKLHVNYNVTEMAYELLRSDSECDLPSCDDFSPIDVLEGKFVTFSNPHFYSNDDFTSSDDESLSDKDVPKDNVNPLFEFDDEYISSDVNPLFNEVLEDIESKASYDSNLGELALLAAPLFDSNEDECFDSGGDVDEINAFDIPLDFEDGCYDSEEDVLYLQSLLSDDTTPNLLSRCSQIMTQEV